MAAKAVPFVTTTAVGDRLLAGLQKVLAAAKAPVSLVPTAVQQAPAGATHLLAGPLCPTLTGELANKYGLTSRISSGSASQWYPSSLYPTLSCEVVQNLYAYANPSFAASAAAPASSKALAVNEESAVKLRELQRDADRAIRTFFQQEATQSLQASLQVAREKALQAKADKKAILVVHTPHGDTYDEMLAAVTKSESDSHADELRSGSVAVEVVPAGAAWPKLVTFPEGVTVMVCPPTEVGDQIATLFAGMAGGSGMVTQQLVGNATIYTCANAADNENPTGALLAACNLLKDLGHTVEAEKIAQAVAKTYAAKILPKDLPGGKAEMDAFIDSVVKNCA